MPLARRELLAAFAAGALVFGLDRLASAGDESTAPKTDGPPKWFKDALAEMKATKSPGVAIVLPPGKEARKALRDRLQTLLRDPPFAAQVNFVEAVYVVVEGRFVGAAGGETAVLIDADGKRIQGAAVDFSIEQFAKTVRPLLRDDGRLAARAKAAQTKEVEKLFADLGGEDPGKTAAAVALVEKSFATIAPAAIATYESTKPGNLNSRLGYAIASAFSRRRDVDADARPMPFGAKWARPAQAPEVPEPDACVGCGMMARSPRRFDALELLAKDVDLSK